MLHWEPALTLWPDARGGYAAHAAAGVGGGRATSLASRRRFCAIAASVNLSCAPRGPRSRRRPSLRIRLRCAKATGRVLGRDAIAQRLPFSECAGGIASALVDAAGDFTLWRLWTAFGLERARATVMGPCAIEDSHPIVNPAVVQELTLWAHIDIAILVERGVRRLNEPSFCLDLSMTGMCGVIFFSSTIQWSVAADP